MSNFFSWERFADAFEFMFPYLPVTLKIMALSALGATVLAIVIAFIQISRIPILRQFFTIYVSFMRGTPIVIQMYIVYYGLPALVMSLSGININRIDESWFVIIAFILNTGAFLSESFRGAILSVPVGQSEAGYSIGLTKVQTFRRIVLPQAFRIMIPTLGAETVGLLQACSIAFLIGVMEVVGAAGAYGTRTKHFVEAYFVAAVMFIVMSILVRVLFEIIRIRFFRMKGKR